MFCVKDIFYSGGQKTQSQEARSGKQEEESGKVDYAHTEGGVFKYIVVIDETTTPHFATDQGIFVSLQFDQEEYIQCE